MAMKRRDFIAGISAATAWPLTVRAQQRDKIARVGVLGSSRENPVSGPGYAIFIAELRKLGFNDGQNLQVEFGRTDEGTAGAFAAANELVAWKADVLVASGPEIALQAAAAARPPVPIVMLASNFDPFAPGLRQKPRGPPAVTSLVSFTGSRSWPESSSSFWWRRFRRENALQRCGTSSRPSRPVRSRIRRARWVCCCARTRRWIKKSAPEVPVIFSYSDETVANSAIPRRSHDGSIYRVSGFTFLGYSTRMPRWVDGDGVPISAKMASARHGTRDIEKIATLEPSWRLIPGEPKQLWCYGLTMTADEVGAALDAAAVSGTALYTRGLPPPLRIWET
jgi:hypothetical protein